MAEDNTDDFFTAEKSICFTCANEMNCDGKNEVGVVVWCTKYAGKYSKPKSNGDRIRSMTDEELAELLVHNPWMTEKSALNWLKMSARTDNTNRCVCCGAIIPEGRMVCPSCERRAEA